MKIKRMGALLLALVMCLSMFSTTAFAYTDEIAAETEATEATEAAVEQTDELPYTFTIDEDGTIILSFDGEEYEYDTDSEDDQTTGKVVTGGSNLNVRTGAGMKYEIIDQLYPGEEVVVIGTEGDWYQIIIPEKTGYVHSKYLELLEEAQENSELDAALIMMLMTLFMQVMDDDAQPALTPDGNLSLVDDVGSATGEGKQFITAVTRNGNYFYIIIDRDADGDETVHFLNQVDEADLLKLMDEEEAAQYIDQTEEPVTKPEPEVTEPVPEETEPAPEEKDEPNMLPLIAVLAVALVGGGAFVFMKFKGKQKEKEAAKPDPDADYVDDDEDYGYVEEDDDDTDFISDAEDNDPV